MDLEKKKNFKMTSDMKKYSILTMAALLAVASCNKEASISPIQETKDVTFNLTISHPQDMEGTKATKTAWEDGDVVFVFFSSAVAPQYLEMRYNGSTWTSTEKNGLSLAENETGTMRAVYLPFGSDASVVADGTSYKFNKTYYTYYLTDAKSYTVEGGEISGHFSMSWPEGYVQFSMPMTNGTTTFFRENAGQYTLTESNLTPVGISSIGADASLTQTSDKGAGDPMPGYYYGAGDDRCILFSGILAAGARNVATNYSFRFVNNDNTPAVAYDDVTYLLSAAGKTLYRSANTGRALKFPLISSNRWTVPVPPTVTIAGIKWAKWNIGATTEEGFGDFFCFGDPFPKASYSTRENTYNNTPYILPSDHDVATLKLGEGWRLARYTDPSDNPEFSALIATKDDASYTWEWVTINGANGWKIYANTTPESYLFLPAAGFWDASGRQVKNSTYLYYGSATNYASALSPGMCQIFKNTTSDATKTDWALTTKQLGTPIRAIKVSDD